MQNKLSKLTIAILSASSFSMVSAAQAQDTEKAEENVEIIEVTGIRSSLTSALAEKRSAENLIEVIKAEDIGKLPDQNLAEVLENVPGIQITPFCRCWYRCSNSWY